MSDLVLGSTTVLSDSSGTPTIQSGVDLGLTADHSGVKTALNASGDASIYACRAWVNFNGTGTVAIRGSGNVSSITDHGTGDYSANFTSAMPDINYSTTQLCGNDGDSGTVHCVIFGANSARTTSAVRFRTIRVSASSGGTYDEDIINIACFR